MGDNPTRHSNNDETYLINSPVLIPDLLKGIPTNGHRRLSLLLMSLAGVKAEGSATTLYHDMSYECIRFGVSCMAFLAAGLFICGQTGDHGGVWMTR